MIKYVWKKMIKDRKDTAGNILFVSCIMAVLIICCHIAVKIREMVENGWYKESIEVASIGDPFIREKMGAILWGMLILVGVVMVFCMVLYALKIKLDIVKEQQRISVFQVLGYTRMQRTLALYTGKLAELTGAVIVGNIIAAGIWRLLADQETFSNLLTLMNENMDYQWMYGILVMLVLAVWQYLVIRLVIQRKINIAVVLKGAEHE